MLGKNIISAIIAVKIICRLNKSLLSLLIKRPEIKAQAKNAMVYLVNKPTPITTPKKYKYLTTLVLQYLISSSDDNTHHN